MKDVKVARIAKKSDKFAGVQLEVPLEQAPQLIHMQNYADSVRIVKSNVGQPAEELEEAGKEDKEVKQAETEKASAKEEKEETKDKKDDSNEAKDKKDE